MTWWTILKNIKGPYTPVEFQTEEEIQDILESRKKREKIYGATPDYDINLGNLRTLNELRAGYFLPKRNNINSKKLTEFKDITFRLIIGSRVIPNVLTNRVVTIESMNFEIWASDKDGYPFGIDYMSNEKNKVGRDWAEIYSKPNHEYKNIKADFIFTDSAVMRIGELNNMKTKLLKVLVDNIDLLSTIEPLSYGDLDFYNDVKLNKILAEKTIDTKISTYEGGVYRLTLPANEQYLKNVISRIKSIRGVKL